MSDISMCKNEECKLKQDCYRYTATPSEYNQSIHLYNFYEEDGEIKCDSFWDNKNRQ